MRIQLECPTCVVMQMTHIFEHQENESSVWPQITRRVFEQIAPLWSTADNPGEIIAHMATVMAHQAGTADLYMKDKHHANQLTEKYWRDHAVPIEDWHSRLLYAAAGNSIDAGLSKDAGSNIAQIDQFIEQGLARNDSLQFFQQVPPPAHILYWLDNAGEAVLDREFIRALRHRGYTVTAVVRRRPFLNDLTYSEACGIQLEDAASDVITGEELEIHPQEFLDAYRADGLISKGIAHWERLSHRDFRQPALFIYRAKCPPSARWAQVQWNDNVACYYPRSV
ncbi:MAG: ARMT1-like domain-containing protein [Firmicutes bacterium]|nr:ARMT1-like domain-containing protein [Bacillota bacterium]